MTANPEEVMRLKIILPTRVLLEREVVKVRAESRGGAYTLLPRHADCLTDLVAGMFSYVDATGREEYAGVDEGTLEKHGREIRMAVRHAWLGGTDPSGFRHRLARALDEEEQRRRRAVGAQARLEADLIRHLLSTRGSQAP